MGSGQSIEISTNNIDNRDVYIYQQFNNSINRSRREAAQLVRNNDFMETLRRRLLEFESEISGAGAAEAEAEPKEESEEFKRTMHEAMSILDKNKDKIPDGFYLEMSNKLMEAYRSS